MVAAEAALAAGRQAGFRMPPAVRDEFRSGFDKAFTNHQAKAEFAHLMILGMIADDVPASLQQLLDDAIASARQTNDVKFRGLYVDWTGTGVLPAPSSASSRLARLRPPTTKWPADTIGGPSRKIEVSVGARPVLCSGP
ncbi:AbiV family abortive infection protein [Streptomyces sp. 3214.6]|uniref:AbiV family abortive infection protein n=1 Tax=Streptomyces sp. 3214.6 TaxID=1882757 RepID=UPI000909FCC6|nr:AbiV family abortive infection protein [Streptomyces sp. 3214.6]SHH40204.1 abortive infection protein, AbiV family [Streptomyces sp. 3214.6]